MTKPSVSRPAAPALAARCSTVRPSATAELFREVADARAAGQTVIGLHVGEPDFPPPDHVRAATQRALDDGHTRYTAVRGIEPLRKAICADSAMRRGGVTHALDEVVVTVGAKQALFNLSLSLFQPGDEVIVPTPCWVSYPDQVRLAGAEPVLVSTEASAFKLTPDALRAAITPRARGLLLCTPHNPTGAAYSREELRALADVVAEHALWVVVDEIYSELTYDGFAQVSLLEVAPELRDRIVIVDGVSKRFAMTGFRIGWLLAPAHVARAAEVFQSQSTTSASTPCQHAALAALEGPAESLEPMRAAFAARRSRVLQTVARIDGVQCRAPEGAFYAFLDVRERLTRPIAGALLEDDVAFCRHLFDRERIALVPGSAFLAPGFVRLSYAAADADLDAALEKLEALLRD